jgi:hypothetical protein
MSNTVESIPPFLVPGFVRCAPICVLYVGPTPPASPRILETFARHPRAVAGLVDPTTIEATAEVTAWLHARQRALGWPPSTSVPNGYYLFHDGEARAYHAGATTGADLPSVGLAVCMQLTALFEGQPWLLRLGAALAQGGPTERVLAAFSALLPPTRQ